jgi:hypothetical protein
MLFKPVSLMLLACSLACCVRAQEQAAVSRADTVYLINPGDDFDSKTGKVDDFKVKADFNTSWSKNKERIEARAREKGANVVLIRFIGWNKHNHGFYASGSLYRADSAKIQRLLSALPTEDDCSIVILRDNGPSLATFYFDVAVNGEQFPRFGDLTFIRKRLDTCDAEARVIIKNKFLHRIPMAGHTRYFRMLTDVGNQWVANGLAVRPNGPVLQEIEDPQLGSLLCRRLKRFEAGNGR